MAPQEGKKVVKKTPAKGGKKKATKKQTGKGKAAREEAVDFGPPLYRRGAFAMDSISMCPYEIRQDTVNLVEDMVVDYCAKIMQDASDQAALRGNKMQAEDILFRLRKDPRKFARAKELLSKNEEIKEARKQFKEDDDFMNK